MSDTPTNAAGLEIIKRNEGLRLHAYPDPATGGAPWTIGYGHTGPDVHPGMQITEGLESRRNGLDGEVLHPYVREFVPSHRCRDSPETRCSH